VLCDSKYQNCAVGGFLIDEDEDGDDDEDEDEDGDGDGDGDGVGHEQCRLVLIFGRR